MWVRFLLLLLKTFKTDLEILKIKTNKTIFEKFLINFSSPNEKNLTDNLKFAFIFNGFLASKRVLNLNFLGAVSEVLKIFHDSNMNNFFLFTWFKQFMKTNFLFFNNFFFIFYSIQKQTRNNHIKIIHFYKFFYFNNFFQLSNLLNTYLNLNILKTGVKLLYRDPRNSCNKFQLSSPLIYTEHLTLDQTSAQILPKLNLIRPTIKFFFWLKRINTFKKTIKKLKIKIFRKMKRKNAIFSFFLSQTMFSANVYNNSYFKTLQNFSFQIESKEVLSINLLRLTSSSPRIHTFELLMYDFNKLSHKVLKNLQLIKIIFIFNLINSTENIFFDSLFNNACINDFDFQFKKIKNLNIFNILKKYSNFLFQNSDLLLSNVSTLLSSTILLNKQKIEKSNFSTSLVSWDNKQNSSFFKTRKPIHTSAFSLQNPNFGSCLFFFKPLNFKFLSNIRLLNDFSVLNFNLNFLYSTVENQLKNFFYFQNDNLFKTNLMANYVLFHVIKKKILKMFNYDKFSPISTPFHIESIIRFFQYCTGKKILFKINPFLGSNLSYYEKARCANWAPKVKVFRKMLGPRLFLAESLEILYLSFKLRDPFFLSHWLINMMKKISFWKYRLFFRYLKYVLRYFFTPMFKELGVKGIKFKLKGKISVAGNARTRTILQRTGKTGHASFDNKILSELSLVRTFTGVIGLKVWIFF